MFRDLFSSLEWITKEIQDLDRILTITTMNWKKRERENCYMIQFQERLQGTTATCINIEKGTSMTVCVKKILKGTRSKHIIKWRQEVKEENKKHHPTLIVAREGNKEWTGTLKGKNKWRNVMGTPSFFNRIVVGFLFITQGDHFSSKFDSSTRSFPLYTFTMIMKMVLHSSFCITLLS